MIHQGLPNEPWLSQANVENIDEWNVQPVIHKSGHVILKAQAWLVALAAGLNAEIWRLRNSASNWTV